LSDYRRRIKKYHDRMKYHVKQFFQHLENNDIIQAAEKAWGAVSAFANIYSITFCDKEVKRDKAKRDKLKEFIDQIKDHDPEINKLVTREYRNHSEILVGSFLDLHGFFYGGSNMHEEDIRRYLEHARKLLPVLLQYADILTIHYIETYNNSSKPKSTKQLFFRPQYRA